ncbi:MAG: GNAT family N-acetyltransferase, partial [Thermotogota bacterium]|nr:GNAT family N-acetyltransferase [Thermotogota bacterium]
MQQENKNTFGNIQTLYKLEKRDIQKASLVLADAFKNDPLWSKTIGNENKAKGYSVMAEMILKYCLKYGQIYAPSDNYEGIMAFSQSDTSYMTFGRLLKSGGIIPLLKFGFKRLITMANSLTPLDEARKKHMKDRSFVYIQAIGVLTKHQGRGYGKKMLNVLIQASDQAKIPIYLDTETES